MSPISPESHAQAARKKSDLPKLSVSVAIQPTT